MLSPEMLPPPQGAVGIDYHHTDGSGLAPTIHNLEPAALHNWFLSHPRPAEEVSIRIYALPLRLNHSTDRGRLTVPFEHDLVNHAIWKPEVYYTLAANPRGGAAALLDEPPRFILQTPLDGGPFCSFALSKTGTVVKGVYQYDDDIFDPAQIAKEDVNMSGWRQRGFQIIVLPQALLRAHSKYMTAELATLVAELDAIESKLVTPGFLDFAAMTRSLHACSSALMKLERRSNFEKILISAIELLASKSRDGQIPWSPIATQKGDLETQAFDFETLPRRIENARLTISGLIQQRNEQMNLEIAQASQRVAEIALSDNKSMKTIAIMTMVFLPGTAVASFFSMSMFDWSADDGNALASKWLWVYFVLAVPLTAIVMAVWWIWGKRMARQALHSSIAGSELSDLDAQPPTFTDVTNKAAEA